MNPGWFDPISRKREEYKVIDKISVALNDKSDAYEAEFSNLGIKKVLVDSGTIKSHPKLLVGGVWCIADIEYEFKEKKNDVPWILSTLKPIQLSHFDFEGYVEARKQFTTDEWIDLLIQSIGFNPEMFGKRSKLTQLVRLIEFAGKQKRVDKSLVDIMKNYMANKSFSRGVETLGAEASMVFVGNTRHTVPYMLYP